MVSSNIGVSRVVDENYHNNPEKFVEGLHRMGLATHFPLLPGTGKPVIVWTSMYLAVPYISSSWVYEATGEKIEWKANEHAVVIIGYTKLNK